MATKAGPDLDRLISHVIFDDKVPHVWVDKPFTVFRECITCAGRWRNETPEPASCSEIPKFSTEIAAGMELLKRLRQLGFSVLIDWSYGHSCHVGLHRDRMFEGVAQTPAEAICRAALDSHQ